MNRKVSWNLLLLLLVAAAFRIVLLDIKPPHFDEGVNGWFVDQITRTGYFSYDPTNYHGPLHFYAVFLSQTLFGRNLWALRLPTLIVSLFCVLLCWKIGRNFGNRAAGFAGWAMAVSPGFVFYGRYAIHESWVVLFLLLFVWGVLEFARHRSRKSQTAMIAAVTGMILTKETYVIHLVSFLLAGALTYVFALLHEGVEKTNRAIANVRLSRGDLRHLAVCLALAVLAIVFFYSGNFLNFPGLRGLWETYAAWFKTGMHEAGGHAKTYYDFQGYAVLNYYWPWLMTRYEWPALLGLLACVRYLFPSRWDLRWIAIYGTGCLYAYTLVPYKTPWCVISLIWPFLLIFGAIIEEASRKWLYAVIPGVALIAISAVQSVKLNFFDYSNHTEPYVYVQTDVEIRRAIGPLLGMAKRDPTYYHKRGQLLLDSYYPLPWILGDFTKVGYFDDEKTPGQLDGDFIFVTIGRQAEVEANLAEPYYRRAFKLRDGMEDCLAYFRASTYGAWFEDEEPEFKPKAK